MSVDGQKDEQCDKLLQLSQQGRLLVIHRIQNTHKCEPHLEARQLPSHLGGSEDQPNQESHCKPDGDLPQHRRHNPCGARARRGQTFQTWKQYQAYEERHASPDHGRHLNAAE